MSEKIIVNVASYQRTDSLILTLKSIYDQCDKINVCLNNHIGEIPEFLFLPKINLTFTDNTKGDAFKFLYLESSDGYFFTIDDDLIYPPDYVSFMVNNCKKHNNKKIVTLHGRSFNKFPISSYYKSATEKYQCLNEVKHDVKVQFGGTGVMCFHTSLFKESIDKFLYPNMADIWIGKFAKEKNIDIICLEHKKGYIKYIEQETTIHREHYKSDKKQTNIVNSIFTEKPKSLSVIIPTYNNVKYIDECINSILESGKNNDIEILVGIDACKKTLEYIKSKTYPKFVNFYYFKENLGPYLIKNSLVKIAKSENIMFFDSDDIMLESTIDEVVEQLKTFDIVRMKYQRYINNRPQNDKNLFGEGVFSIKKSIFLDINGFEPWKVAADSDFMSLVYKIKLKIYQTEKTSFYYRQHSESLTKRKDTGMESELRQKYHKISKNKKSHDNPNKLYVSDFILVDSNTIIDDLENTESTNNSDFNNYVKTRLDLVLNPQPKKITRNQIHTKKGPIINGKLGILENDEKSLENKIKLKNSETNKPEIKTNNSINKKLFSVKTEITSNKNKPTYFEKPKI